MSIRPVDIVLVAIGGYGVNYVNHLLDHGDAHQARLVGAVDPFATNCPRLDDLKAHGVPIFDDLDAFYATRNADLAVISSPIHFHAPQAIAALEHGSHVLCEKPAAATMDEVQRMIHAADDAKRMLAIGYQWSYSPAILELKSHILAGRFGRPRVFRNLVGWPRLDRYYARANWAGRIQLPDGRCVFDSPANNATAHFLHNLLFLLGGEMHTAADIATVTAERYRAKPIENYDTAMFRIATHDGVMVYFYTSHSTHEQFGPQFELQFDDAIVRFTHGDESMTATFTNGTTHRYGLPDYKSDTKLWRCVDAVRTGEQVPCDIRTASAQTLCIDAAQRSRPIVDFPVALLRDDSRPPEGVLRYVEGLADVMHRCFEADALPSELGDVGWSRPAEPLRVG